MIKQVIVVRKDLNMRKGKMVAQGAHAAMAFLLQNVCSACGLGFDQIETMDIVNAWIKSGQTKICLSVDSKEELEALIVKAEEAKVPVHSIIDSGKTEFHGIPTLTCAAFGPFEADEIDKITGGLKLL